MARMCLQNQNDMILSAAVFTNMLPHKITYQRVSCRLYVKKHMQAEFCSASLSHHHITSSTCTVHVNTDNQHETPNRAELREAGTN